VIKKGAEMMRGRFVLPAPADLAASVRPIIAISRKFAVACYPWSSTFAVFVLRSGACSPSFLCKYHTRPVSCVAISGRWVISASHDCTLRLCKVNKSGEPGRHRAMLANHTQPIVCLKISEKLKEAFSVSRDGFLVSMSLFDGRYLGGVKLPLSDPSDMVVSEHGFVAVSFNGPDSHIVVVLGQNMEIIAKKTFDGCVACWATHQHNGIDVLVVALKNADIVMVGLPEMEQVTLGTKLPSVPEMIACMKSEPGCIVGLPDGTFLTIPIGSFLPAP
jgi:hypothetical protein